MLNGQVKPTVTFAEKILRLIFLFATGCSSVQQIGGLNCEVGLQQGSLSILSTQACIITLIILLQFVLSQLPWGTVIIPYQADSLPLGICRVEVRGTHRGWQEQIPR